MRALTIRRHGGPEVLEVREAPEPEPSAGEVRVRVRAAGLNFSDVMARKGLYPDAPKPPCVMGYEAAGEVDALGKGVDGPAVGTRVIVLSRFGAQAEKVCVPVRQVMEMPAGASFEDAAALPVVYLTAYHMLFRVAPLRPGRRVLVHMAAGGVGIAAIQLCRTVADIEIFGTASPSKHEYLREIGCHHPIDYRSTDYVAEVLRLTEGEGVDLVLDPLGGRDWKKGFSLLRPAGHLVAFGFANMSSGQRRSILHAIRQAMGIPFYTPLGLMNVNKSVSGVNIGHLWGEIDMLAEELADLLALWKDGKIEPRVDAVVPFDRAAEAHGRLEGRQNVGKVVLVP